MEWSQIRDNISAYYEDIEMPGGYSWNLPQTIRRIDLYLNSRFETGSVDSSGKPKYFFNVVKPAAEVATKMIDLDTKNILLYSQRTDDEYKVWLMKRDLELWLKEKKFGRFINELTFRYPRYGHLVSKRQKTGDWKALNIHNIRCKPDAATLEESPFVYEAIPMNGRDIFGMKSWDAEAIQELFARNPNDTQFVVYECFHQQNEGKKWKRKIIADFLAYQDGTTVRRAVESEINREADYITGICLYEDEQDELPYREEKWEGIPGRWLGLGVVEQLFDPQIRMNEIANQKARGLELASLQLFQTPDEDVRGNVLTDLENGDIIFAPQGLSPVATEARNMGIYAQEESRWDRNIDQLSFSYDIARGEELPSGTPLGVARLSAAMVESYYSLKRENLGMFLKAILLEDVLPYFAKDTSKEHVLRLFGSDKEIEKVRKSLVDHAMRKSVMQYAVKTGTVPSKFAIEAEKIRLLELARKKKDVPLLIPKDFYKDVETALDITITGEEVDVAGKMQSLMNALQLIAGNPALMQNPMTRTLVVKMFEMAGISAVDIEQIEEASQQPGAQPGMQPGAEAKAVPRGAKPPQAPTQGDVTTEKAV